MRICQISPCLLRPAGSSLLLAADAMFLLICLVQSALTPGTPGLAGTSFFPFLPRSRDDEDEEEDEESSPRRPRVGRFFFSTDLDFFLPESLPALPPSAFLLRPEVGEKIYTMVNKQFPQGMPAFEKGLIFNTGPYMHAKNWPVKLRSKNCLVKLRRNISLYHRNITLFRCNRLRSSFVIKGSKLLLRFLFVLV